ncbi:hypothetical protein GALLR39Z86_26580 [Glycomyces algeriensis]|uniref:Uncharacterized protein n=2 Tax=Glycomyces algeriensis TaxID=256037 RepID=A0A9W6LGN9_9ACTN|nr:hypothetical protein GALLR39Z86_26580 [Glycomyces algeriensis]
MLAREARGFELGKAKGRAAGTAEALLQMIVARGQELSDEQRARIHECDDTAQLMDWIRRASKLPSMYDVLGIRDPWI